MSSLTNVATQLKQQKSYYSKLKRDTQKALDSSKTVFSKSSSKINSIQKRADLLRSELDDINGILERNASQIESINRLRDSAQERIDRDRLSQKQLEDELKSCESDDEKTDLKSRIGYISDSISQLSEEIKLRTNSAKKINKVIDEFAPKKSLILKQIKKTLESRPELQQAVKTSSKEMKKLESQLSNRLRQEENTEKRLKKINQKISTLEKTKKEIKENMRKKKATLARKKKATQKKKESEEKRILALAKKLAAKMIVSAKKSAPKRKAPAKK